MSAARSAKKRTSPLDAQLESWAEQAVGIFQEFRVSAAVDQDQPKRFEALDVRMARGELVGRLLFEFSASGRGRLRLELVDVATGAVVALVADRVLAVGSD